MRRPTWPDRPTADCRILLVGMMGSGASPGLLDKPCRVVLVGMMGSGKSTIGRLVAARTGWPYLDNDVLLERIRGESARDALGSGGLRDLRAYEALALRLGLHEPEPCFVGAAAGTVLDGEVRAAMVAKALVVWLDASPDTLARRARGSGHRPWLEVDAAAWMRSTLAERAPLYKSVADLIVNTQQRPVNVAEQIIDWLREQPGCRRLVDSDRGAPSG